VDGVLLPAEELAIFEVSSTVIANFDKVPFWLKSVGSSDFDLLSHNGVFLVVVAVTTQPL
jgi:hypothetical protein